MARAIVSAAMLLLSTAPLARAQEVSAEIQAAADEAGVDGVDLLGAMHTTGLDARPYLIAIGALASPSAVAAGSQGTSPALVSGWPINGALGQRIYCIESYESHHDGGAVNHSSGAAGWLQWLPGTARTWGVAVGNRWSEWQGAARIASLGERFFRSQWVPLQAGWC